VDSPDRKRARLLALDAERGPESRTLGIGPWAVKIAGLDDPIARELDLRWGGFVERAPAADPTLTVRVLRGDAGLSMGRDRPGAVYRLEAEQDPDHLLVRSHHVAICREDGDPAAWRAGMAVTDDEPPARTLENVVRYLVARLCVRDGGFALHGAGVVHDQRAHIFAGPSRSGKSTAVGLSPGESLGDDFGVVIHTPGGWRTAAVPFDNRACAPASPARGLIPLAAVWRLEHGASAEIRSVPPIQAATSLMACTALPWAMPDLAGDVLEHVRRYVSTGTFGILEFGKDSNFWPLIDSRV
jgi:hypothetical protein